MAIETTTKVDNGNAIAKGISGALSGGLQAYNDSKKLQIQQGLAKVQADQFQLEAEKYKVALADHDAEIKAKGASTWDSFVMKYGSMSPEDQKAYLKIPANQQAIVGAAKAAQYTNDPNEALTYLQEGAKPLAGKMGVVRDALTKLNAAVNDPNVDKKIANGDIAKLMATKSMVSEMYGFGFKDQIDNIAKQYDAVEAKLTQVGQDKQKGLDRANDVVVAATKVGQADQKEFRNTLAVVSGEKGSKQTEFGKAADKVSVSDKVLALIDSPEVIKNGGVSEEMALAAATLVTGSSRVNHEAVVALRADKGLFSSFQQAKEWFLSHPQEVLTLAQAENFRNQVQREHDQWTGELVNKYDAFKARYADQGQQQQMDTVFSKAFPGAYSAYQNRVSKAAPSGEKKPLTQNGGGMTSESFINKYKTRPGKLD